MANLHQKKEMGTNTEGVGIADMENEGVSEQDLVKGVYGTKDYRPHLTSSKAMMLKNKRRGMSGGKRGAGAAGGEAGENTRSRSLRTCYPTNHYAGKMNTIRSTEQ